MIREKEVGNNCGNKEGGKNEKIPIQIMWEK
jgi:hypothetical protein